MIMSEREYKERHPDVGQYEENNFNQHRRGRSRVRQRRWDNDDGDIPFRRRSRSRSRPARILDEDEYDSWFSCDLCKVFWFLQLMARVFLFFFLIVFWWKSLPENFPSFKAISVQSNFVSFNYSQLQNDADAIGSYIRVGSVESMHFIKTSLAVLLLFCFIAPYLIRFFSITVIPFVWFRVLPIHVLQDSSSWKEFLTTSSAARATLLTNTLITVLALVIIFLVTGVSLLSILSLVVKQIVLMALFMAIPAVFLSNISPEFLADPVQFLLINSIQRDAFLLATGVTLFLMGFIYKLLPLDVIPTWIPFFGMLDEMVASFSMVIGILIGLSGMYCWFFGGPTVDRSSLISLPFTLLQKISHLLNLTSSS